MGELWAELGVAPTQDASVIRRAYAAKLKTIRPDQDAEAFARLRQAYERALASAARPPPSKQPAPPASHGAPTPPEAPTPPLPGPVPAPRRPPVAAETMTRLLRRGDVLAAAQWLVDARAALQLGLQEDMRLTDQLGWTLARNLDLPAEPVAKAAALLDWPAQANGAWAADLRARLEAEAWYAGLRRTDASWTRWVGAGGPVAARTLLGKGRPHLLPAMSRDPSLRKRYGEYLLHRPYVGDRFDRERIEALDAFMTRKVKRPGRVASVFVALIIVPAAVGDMAGDLDHRLQGPVTGLTLFAALGLGGYAWLRKRRPHR